MPELPEVETIRQGLAPVLKGRTVEAMTVRQPSLRWPTPVAVLQSALVGQVIREVGRRGRYLLLDTVNGWVMIHLGMSGSLRLLSQEQPWRTHDHLEWRLSGPFWLRYHDPRRFGAILWHQGPPDRHPLLIAMGPEPLAADFHGPGLQRSLLKRQAPIKSLLMDNRIVAGVGNIYANESLYRAGIHPTMPGGALSVGDCQMVVDAVKQVLREALAQGGTTLRNFVDSDGHPGYFQQSLRVYGRVGQSCLDCGTVIEKMVIGGRASYFCPVCQPLVKGET